MTYVSVVTFDPGNFMMPVANEDKHASQTDDTATFMLMGDSGRDATVFDGGGPKHSGSIQLEDIYQRVQTDNFLDQGVDLYTRESINSLGVQDTFLKEFSRHRK